MNSKKATYQEVAAQAGVSIATVSRIITGSSRVKEDTRERVLEVMAARGFNVTELRQAPRLRNSGLIIFNIPSTANPFYSPVVRGAKSAARQYGYQLLINEEHINDSTFPALTGLLHKLNPAGLITANHVPQNILKKLSGSLPLVQCCEFDGELDLPYVSIDDTAAARSAMEYLISQGRRNIAFLNGPLRYKYARLRFQGYLDSLEKAGIPRDPGLIVNLPEINYDTAVSAVSQLLGSGKTPDAFFCVSDVYAAAAIRACAKMNLRVPGDVMVAGFDNVDISYMTNPAITTVYQPKFQLGFSSCELLVELIANPGAKVRNILLETELVVRESTAPGVSGTSGAVRSVYAGE